MVGIGYPLLWPGGHYMGGKVPATMADLDQQMRDSEQRTKFAPTADAYAPDQGATGVGQWSWALPTITITPRTARPFVTWSVEFEYLTTGGGTAGVTQVGSIGVRAAGQAGKLMNVFAMAPATEVKTPWRSVYASNLTAQPVNIGIEAFSPYTVYLRNIYLRASAL